MTDTDTHTRVLPSPDDGQVPTGQLSTGPNTPPDRAVDALFCGVVATLTTALALASAYFTSSANAADREPPSFRDALITPIIDPDGLITVEDAILAFGVIMTVLAVVLSTASRIRVGRGRMASTGMWLGVVNLIAYSAFAAMFALQSIENHPGVSSFDDAQARHSLIDSLLAADLRGMAVRQDLYVTAHPDQRGVAVAATKPGGAATVTAPNDFHGRPGNVISVKVGPSGYCVSAYNKDATRAISPAASMLYRSDGHRIEDSAGTC